MRTVLLIFALVVWTTSVYAQLPDDIIFYMSFDEGTGATVQDLSGNGNDGAIEGSATWQAGQYGNAINLDGATYITVPNAEPLASISHPMSVGAWVNPEALDGWRNIVEMDGPAGWKLGYRDTEVVFTTYFVQDFVGQTPLDLNQWSHVAATWDGAEVNLYINGELDSGGPIAGGGVIDVSGEPSLDIGYRSSSASSHSQGAVDDLWISTTVKSQAEVQRLMEGFAEFTAVEPVGKLTTTWGRLKVD